MTIEDARLKELIERAKIISFGFDDPEDKDTADALTELLRLRQEGRWIPVTEAMPPERTDVLAYWSNAGFYVTSWFKWETMEKPLWSPAVPAWGEVTHWRPLPAAPEGGPKTAASSGVERKRGTE